MRYEFESSTLYDPEGEQIFPGQRFLLPDGTEVWANEAIGDPIWGGLETIGGDRRWSILPDGTLAAHPDPDQRLTNGTVYLTMTTEPTSMSIDDLTPIEPSWERRRLGAARPKCQLLDELAANPTVYVDVALVVELTNTSYQPSDRDPPAPAENRDCVSGDFEDVLQHPESPVVRVEIASGADPEDVRRLLRKLIHNLDEFLDSLVQQRGW